MEIVRFALGARFDARGRENDPAFVQGCMAAFFQALRPEDVAGFLFYGGIDAVTDPQAPAFIAVVMGGSLKATRRLYASLSAGLCPLLCPQKPFIESNRIEHLSDLTFYGQGQPDGSLADGGAEGTLQLIPVQKKEAL